MPRRGANAPVGRAVLGAVGFCVMLVGCAARGAAPVTVQVAPPPRSAVRAPEAAALPALTEEERAMVGRLRATVQHLSVDIGERNVAASWNLASATDDLAIALEKMGYTVERQGVVAGDEVVQNIGVHLTGGEHGGQVIVVGAHYDTSAGTPGADEDASGVAAVMELASAFRLIRAKRALHFALFVNGEPPYARTDQMGSLVYAKGLQKQGLEIKGMLSLDGLGAYSDAPPARAYPPAVPPYPARSDFLALIGNEASRALLEQVSTSMRRGAIPVVGSVMGDNEMLEAGADQWAFWKLGVPALLVTDVGVYRYRDHRQKTDLPDKLDYERMARVVSALKKTIADLIEAT